jgi:hypothetical protein
MYQEFRQCDISVDFAGHQNFFKLKVVADVIAYFRLLVNPYNDDIIACYKTFILARLGDSFLDRIKKCSFARAVPVLDFIQNNGWLKSVDLCEDVFVPLLGYREQVKYLIGKYSWQDSLLCLAELVI